VLEHYGGVPLDATIADAWDPDECRLVWQGGNGISQRTGLLQGLCNGEEPLGPENPEVVHVGKPIPGPEGHTAPENHQVEISQDQTESKSGGDTDSPEEQEKGSVPSPQVPTPSQITNLVPRAKRARRSAPPVKKGAPAQPSGAAAAAPGAGAMSLAARSMGSCDLVM
jgi:hypothetical protein